MSLAWWATGVWLLLLGRALLWLARRDEFGRSEQCRSDRLLLLEHRSGLLDSRWLLRLAVVSVVVAVVIVIVRYPSIRRRFVRK